MNGRALENYMVALRTCPPSGRGVHAWMMATANHAAAAGIDQAQAVSEITAAASRPPSPGGEVRDTVARAFRERGARVEFGAFPFPPPRPKPKPKPAPLTAQAFVEAGCGATASDIWEASPVQPAWGDGWQGEAIAQLTALFKPGELVFCGDRYGKEVRPVEEWVARLAKGAKIPPFLCVNPLKQGGGMTAGGKPSPRCDDAVAVYRHTVAEMDDMPLADQLAFWRGLEFTGVVTLTYSGSKSLHAVLRVDMASREEWNRDIRDGLFSKLLIPLGCDKTCVNPSRLSRLAGSIRADKGGTVQKLLYCREALAWDKK